jgi:hypothetical protein
VVTGQFRRVNRCRALAGLSRLGVSKVQSSSSYFPENFDCATLAADGSYPLQPQDYFEICFASPGFFSGGFRETSSTPGTLTNIEAVDGKGVGGSLTGQGANITHFQWRCRTLFSHDDEIEIIQIEKR